MVAFAALEVGRRTLPDYAHRFAPKTFTQPQLFACLVLKAFFRRVAGAGGLGMPRTSALDVRTRTTLPN